MESGVSTKRTPIQRASKGRITPEAVAIFREIGEHETAIRHLRVRLSRALGRPEPWRTHVLDAVDDAPAWVNDKRDWREAAEILEELEALARAAVE
jgi:hypothetical protein